MKNVQNSLKTKDHKLLSLLLSPQSLWNSPPQSPQWVNRICVHLTSYLLSPHNRLRDPMAHNHWVQETIIRRGWWAASKEKEEENNVD